VASRESILNLSTVDGHLALDFMPTLESDPELRGKLLGACARTDLYLIAVGSFNDLVLRHDLRRAAIREFAANVNLGTWALRWTALKARLTMCVFRDNLTKRGSVEARGADERLLRLAAQLHRAPAQL
jgi:hypothetical protein